MPRRLVLFAMLACVTTLRADLFDYVKKPDASFKWEIGKKNVADSGTTYTIDMTSQTWEGIKWEHQVLVSLPTDVRPTDSMFLFNEGGRADPLRAMMAFKISRCGKMPVAFLNGILNQPLLDGKK